MKKVAILLVLLVLAAKAFSQTREFKPINNEFAKEFARLVDSTRESLYTIRSEDLFNVESKSWVKVKTPFANNIDSLASLACFHNNRYFYKLVANQPLTPIIIGHENKIELHDMKYSGSDTLLNSFVDRCNYYTDSLFTPYGECVWAGYTTSPKYRNLSSCELAREAFNIFMKSKEGHREILLYPLHTDFGINLMIDSEQKRFYITVVTGKKKA
jgi:hypothetical protein